MKKPKCLLLLAFVFALVIPLPSEAQTVSLVVNGNDFRGLDSLDRFLGWAIDPTGNMHPDEAQHLPFKGFSGSFELDKNAAYWFRLTLCNNPPDSLKALFCMDKYLHADLFFQKKQTVWEHRKAGMATNYSERSFPQSRNCHPIKLAEGQEQTYYLQLSDYFHTGPTTPNFCLFTLTQEKEKRLEEAIQNSGNQLFKGIFFGTLLLLLFFSLVQFSLNQDRAYLFYAGYVAALFFFYVRSMDLEPSLPFFGDLKAYHCNLEAPLGYLIYIFYLQFIRTFLDLPNQLPFFDRFMRGGVAVFAILLAVDLLILQVFWGWRASLAVHYFIKTPFFILSFWAVVTVVVQLKSRLANYILTGASLLLLPALFTVWVDMAPGVYRVLWHSTARSFTPAGSGLTFYMYDMRVGLLFEMLCFLLGLTWKIKKENERIRALAFVQPIGLGDTALKISAPTVLPDEKPLLQAVRSAIQENLSDEDFNVEKLAKKMAMSRTKLFRNLQAEGVNASELIQSMRLQKAQSLLESTTKTLAQVADEVGYKSAGQLSRAYKRVFGVSPRNQNGGV